MQERADDEMVHSVLSAHCACELRASVEECRVAGLQKQNGIETAKFEGPKCVPLNMVQLLDGAELQGPSGSTAVTCPQIHGRVDLVRRTALAHICGDEREEVANIFVVDRSTQDMGSDGELRALLYCLSVV